MQSRDRRGFAQRATPGRYPADCSSTSSRGDAGARHPRRKSLNRRAEDALPRRGNRTFLRGRHKQGPPRRRKGYSSALVSTSARDRASSATPSPAKETQPNTPPRLRHLTGDAHLLLRLSNGTAAEGTPRATISEIGAVPHEHGAHGRVRRRLSPAARRPATPLPPDSNSPERRSCGSCPVGRDRAQADFDPSARVQRATFFLTNERGWRGLARALDDRAGRSTSTSVVDGIARTRGANAADKGIANTVTARSSTRRGGHTAPAATTSRPRPY